MTRRAPSLGLVLVLCGCAMLAAAALLAAGLVGLLVFGGCALLVAAIDLSNGGAA